MIGQEGGLGGRELGRVGDRARVLGGDQRATRVALLLQPVRIYESSRDIVGAREERGIQRRIAGLVEVDVAARIDRAREAGLEVLALELHVLVARVPRGAGERAGRERAFGEAVGTPADDHPLAPLIRW